MRDLTPTLILVQAGFTDGSFAEAVRQEQGRQHLSHAQLHIDAVVAYQRYVAYFGRDPEPIFEADNEPALLLYSAQYERGALTVRRLARGGRPAQRSRQH